MKKSITVQPIYSNLKFNKFPTENLHLELRLYYMLRYITNKWNGNIIFSC